MLFCPAFFKKLADSKGRALNDIILIKNSAMRNFYRLYCAN